MPGAHRSWLSPLPHMTILDPWLLHWPVPRGHSLLPTSLLDSVTESKLILLTAQQADELREELLGQRIVTLFVKPADQEGGD